MTVPGKTDHFVIISDFKILVPCSSMLFTLCNGKITIVIAYTVLASKDRSLFNRKQG